MAIEFSFYLRNFSFLGKRCLEVKLGSETVAQLISKGGGRDFSVQMNSGSEIVGRPVVIGSGLIKNKWAVFSQDRIEIIRVNLRCRVDTVQWKSPWDEDTWQAKWRWEEKRHFLKLDWLTLERPPFHPKWGVHLRGFVENEVKLPAALCLAFVTDLRMAED